LTFKIRGNLLTVPLDDSLLYIEPVYLQAENLNLPELKQVILADTSRVVMEATLEEAIAYAKNCDELKWDEVEFMFIDRWWCDTDKYSNTKFDEPAVIINKETK